MALPWNEKVWLGEDDPDRIGQSEGDLCLLPSGIIIAGVLTSAGVYSVPMWAIRPTSPPEVGPVFFGNFPPGTSTFDDRYFDDINFLVPIGENSFVYIGEAWADFDADGTYNPSSGTYGAVAVVCDVDPDTLVITHRTAAVLPWDLYYADENTAATWQGDKVVILPAQYYSATADRIAIVTAAGGASMVDVTYPGRDPGSFRPGPIVVSGNRGFYIDDSGELLVRFDLPGGGGATTVPWIGGHSSWSNHGCTLADGNIAFVYTLNSSGTHQIPRVAVINANTLATMYDFALPYVARLVGWTGGWYSNVRSISQLPDGNLLLGFAVGTSYFVEVVTVSGEPVYRQEQVPDTTVPFNAATFVWQVVPTGLPGGLPGIGCLLISQRSDFKYGAYYFQTFRGTAQGALDRTERRFVHRADRD